MRRAFPRERAGARLPVAVLLASVLVASVAGAVGAPPARAADPYAADPLHLVPFADTAQRLYTVGTDRWEVWVCDVPGWSAAVDPGTVAAGLNANVAPYFAWVSGGDYSPTFAAGGRVASADAVSPDPARPESLAAPGCESAVSAAATSNPHGALIVLDGGFDEGYATMGAVCPEPPFTGCSTSYPANARTVVVGAATVTTTEPFPAPQWITVAHEMGHALAWGHSFSGLTIDPSTGAVDRYDNPMDVMSGGVHSGLPIGTVGYFRYAAGWITPAEAVVHEAGLASYVLRSDPAAPGIHLVVIPSPEPGRFFTLDARRRASYDAPLPRSGVEVYEVDQRREVACALPSAWPATWPCFGPLVRVTPFPATAGRTSTAHVLGIDDAVRVGRFLVTVVAADTGSLTVRVADVGSGRFVDDDGNPHERDIEAIATLGITSGCAVDRYCPAAAVTRGEMAAFLVRALGEVPSLRQGSFPDVPADAWYTPFVERLAEIGITVGYDDGTFRPGATVSRAEMAVFLARAFGTAPLPPAVGIFADVPPAEWYAPAAEEIRRLGFTDGCATAPLRYCPADPVRRDHMATFLARAVGAGL